MLTTTSSLPNGVHARLVDGVQETLQKYAEAVGCRLEIKMVRVPPPSAAANGKMDADHVSAWSKGGESSAENCQMLCTTHNRAKGNR